MSVWTTIPAYVLDKMFGYQAANLLRENVNTLAAVPYIVKSKTTPDGSFLPAAQPLDLLASGYVKNTTGTGVLTTTPTIPSTDISGTVPATPHHTQHDTGGSDAIAALSGNVITTGTVAAARLGTHHATHDTGGADALVALDAAVLTTGLLNIARLPANVRQQNIYFHIADYASPGGNISTGVAGFWVVPWAGTITQAVLLSIDPAATAGNIVIDIWKDNYASFPPTVADSICASAKPTLSSSNKYQDSTLTGWTTSVAPGDVMGFNVDSVSGVTHVVIELRVTLT